jgi:hypothetical protein
MGKCSPLLSKGKRCLMTSNKKKKKKYIHTEKSGKIIIWHHGLIRVSYDIRSLLDVAYNLASRTYQSFL